MAGVRGLLMLLAWRDSVAEVVPRRLQPHESGLFGRRYAELEEFEYARRLFRRRGLPWDEALRELRVPLRALAAFYERRQLGTFPPWALADIELLDLVARAAVDGDERSSTLGDDTRMRLAVPGVARAAAGALV